MDISTVFDEEQQELIAQSVADYPMGSEEAVQALLALGRLATAGVTPEGVIEFYVMHHPILAERIRS